MCEIIKQKKRETSFEISRFFLPLQCLTSVLSLRTSGIRRRSFAMSIFMRNFLLSWAWIALSILATVHGSLLCVHFLQLPFFLAIVKTSDVVILFYTTPEVYTKLGIAP